MANKIQIGLDKLYYAPVVKDDAKGVTYGEMVPLPLVQSIGIEVSKSEGEVFADDKLAESYSAISFYTISIGSLYLSEKDRAYLNGHTYDETSQTVIERTTDVSPQVGLAFRSANSDGTYKYVKVFKGSFSASSENFSTKGESVEFQTKEIQAKFLPRDFDDALRITSENPTDGATWFTEFGDEGEAI